MIGLVIVMMCGAPDPAHYNSRWCTSQEKPWANGWHSFMLKCPNNMPHVLCEQTYLTSSSGPVRSDLQDRIDQLEQRVDELESRE